MAELSPVFYLLLFVVAFLYAAVGHGGASGYLALMALFNVSPVLMRPSALILNIFVSLMAFYQYFRKGNFNWQLFLTLVVVSMPAAFLGGMVMLDPTIYKRILGIILLLPIIRFAGFWPQQEEKKKKAELWLTLFIGASIGFLSGLIGIGGGIILTPVLLLLAWANMKEAAGISALFITLNSIAGLLGNLTAGMELGVDIFWMVATALAGGTIGSYLGASYFSGTFLKRLLALVLVIACFKLLFT